MDRFGFIFPGQGSQKLGMLRDLADEYDLIEETYAEASAILDQDLWEIAQLDTQNTLDQTQLTQPVLLSASVAIWRLWQQQSIPLPAIMAGHSLGEYSALVCAGVIPFTDAIKLVHQRGQYMQSAVPAGCGKMAVIVGLEIYKIREVCQDVEKGQVVSPANINSREQTVIAGDVDAVERAMIACKAAGAKRALPLAVSVPSHCALMQPAAARLERDLNVLKFNRATIPVVQNVNAEIATDPEEIKQNLIRQLYEPVLWVDTIELMHKAKVVKIVECGPGKVLCGLVRRIQSGMTAFSTEDCASFAVATEEMSV
ncbi:MAG: ACP S-malonyltransferase [Gammaproteobacteria bacterium]|jgi:[acyl-carrier-protein] S-malonyltransferase|nr:[acyl-carrier-protein] S-malonyltransferase [Gammaproteobacteria bacterium]MDP6098410.1 ACP S-malonyltransferase [Gammaproteobacteria bacterium]HJO11629.1 ACP S-malonyltransferase [Gammaproteobacteria bacterium]|tara:strand:- start:178 stop:1116 length:939 start_codon:yes stop_codon:yes gene_type:complete